MANILTPFGLTPEHFARIDQMKTDPSSFGFKNQFDYAKASGKDLVDRSMPGFGIPSMMGQVLATPFYDTYSGIQESKKPYKDDFTQYSGITDYDEMPVGPSLSEVAKGIKDEKIGTMMGGRFLGGLESLLDTGKNYASTISNAFFTPLNAYEFDTADIESRIEAAKNREALNKQGLLSLDDAGLISPDYEDFAQKAKPGLNLGFAKQLGKRLGTGILSVFNPFVGAITGLANFANRTGLPSTFKQSDSLVEFARNVAQQKRDKKAREEAARRGEIKDLQGRIDRGDFGGTGGGGFQGAGGYGSSAERGAALHG